jgi:hypothetical protein
MRHRALHDAVLAFSEQAAWQLAADAADGAEIPFELDEVGSGRGPALYCYRPLTEEFIRSRVGVLGRLPGYDPAARLLAGVGGLDAYLRLRGETRVPTEPAECADAVLRTFLGQVFEDASEFVLDEGRFGRAYADLERGIMRDRTIGEVVGVVHGLVLAGDEVALGQGLSLVRAGALAAPPAGLDRLGAEPDQALVVLREEGGSEAEPPVTAARMRFRRLLSALRLYDAGPFALGPIGWSRIDGGTWRTVPFAAAGRGARDPLLLDADAEDELRAFCNLVARRMPRGGEVAWALGRFEMALERPAPFEALTDLLLALRALLEPEGPAGGRLPRRLAAICAVPADRAALAERVAHAIALEQALIGGVGMAWSAERGAPAAGPGVDVVVAELEHHLRALLRDVLCGHLDSDLRTVADELLAGMDPVGDELEDVPEIEGAAI